MSQLDTKDLSSIVACLTSPESDHQSRQDAEKIIMNSISDEFFQTFIELIKFDQSQEQKNYSSIIIFSDILKSINVIKSITNIISVLSEIYALSIQLILDSTSTSTSHFPAILLITCVNSSIEIASLTKTDLELLFFQDLFEGIITSTTSSSLHGFCFATRDLLNDYSLSNYCSEEEFVLFLSGIITLLQNNYSAYEEEKDSKKNDIESSDLLEIFNDIFELNKTIFEQDEICVFFNENQQVFQDFIQTIFNFINFPETFSSLIDCITSLAESDQTLLFPYLPFLFDVMTNFIDESTFNYTEKLIYDSVTSISNFVYYLSKENTFLFLDLDYFSIIMLLCKIIANAPPNCDSIGDWEPHIICQEALYNIVSEISLVVTLSEKIPSFVSPEDQENIYIRFNSIITDLFSFAENLLSSNNYNEVSASLAIFQTLFEKFGDKIFFPVKELIFQHINNDVPRVREASIHCLVGYVSSFPDHRCSNEKQFSAISEIFEISNDHINEFSMPSFSDVDQNDCISISDTTFLLLYYLSLIPGFESLSELMNIIFYNLPFLISVHRNDGFWRILKMIKRSHFSIIHSFSTIEQLLFLILTKSDQLDQSFAFSNFSCFDDLIPSVIDIIFEYCDRFGDKLEIPDDLIQNLIEFCLSLQSNQSTYPLPLISFVFSKDIADIQNFSEYTQPLCQLSLSLLQANSEIYTDQNLNTFFQFSIHSILFFKYMMIGDYLPEELMENIFDLILQFTSGYIKNEEEEENNENDDDDDNDDEIQVPFDLQTYSLNLALMIAKIIPEFMTCNGEMMIYNLISILNSSNFFTIGKIKKAKLFKNVMQSTGIIVTTLPQEYIIKNYPMLINNLVILIITLKRQSSLNQAMVCKLFYFIAGNFPDIVRNAFIHQMDDLLSYIDYFSSNQVMAKKIIDIVQAVGLKLMC